MRHVYYYEYYPHYMGTMIATVKMTMKEFEQLCALGKKIVGLNEDEAYDEYLEFMNALEAKNNAEIYAMDEVFAVRGRSTRILNKVQKGEVWSGEWEEGSFAFASKLRDAKDAIRKIEGKHINLD